MTPEEDNTLFKPGRPLNFAISMVMNYQAHLKHNFNELAATERIPN